MREYMGVISFHEWQRHREKWQRLDDAVRRVARKLLAEAVDNTKGDGIFFRRVSNYFPPPIPP